MPGNTWRDQHSPGGSGPQCPRVVGRVAQCLSESCGRPGPETALGLGWPLKAAVILTGTWLLLTQEAALSPDPVVAGGLSFTPQWCPRLLLYPLSSKVCELGNPSTCHSFHGLALGVVRPRHPPAQMRVPRIKLVYAGLGEQRKQWPARGSPGSQGASERRWPDAARSSHEQGTPSLLGLVLSTQASPHWHSSPTPLPGPVPWNTAAPFPALLLCARSQGWAMRVSVQIRPRHGP